VHTDGQLDLMMLNDIRRLADEARQAAARAPLGSAEHAFYSGALSAAERHLHAGLMAADDPAWFDREPAAFRDGYLETSALIGFASSELPVHLSLPAY